MAKRRPTDKTQHQRLASTKSTRQERRQAARNDTKAQRTVEMIPVGGFSRQDALALLALGLLVVVCYLPAMLWGGFVWDDNLCIKVDPVRNVSGLWQIWFSPSAIEKEHHYWPLVYTTFWLEHKLWGFDPTGYHVVNVLLHLANTLLLWHLVRRLAVPGAWVVAAVFAVHPLHVESVAWVIERKDVLSGLFYLAAVLAWMRFVEQPRRGWYVCSLVLYAAGLLSKSIVVTLPVALLIWHWWQQGRVTSTDLLRLVPFGVVGLIITVGDLSFYQSRDVLALGYSLTERTLIAARALWFYAGKLLWPSSLAVIYPLWDILVSDPLAWAYLIAAVSLAVALWGFRYQLGRGPLAGALFFAVTLSPVLGFVDYGYMEYAFVADRFQYLAGIGVIAVVIGTASHGVRHLPDLWQKGAWGVAAVVIVVLGLMTWQQARIWKDNETLNRHIIAHNPQARSAHLNLGNALSRQGRHEEALAAYRVEIQRRPDYFKTHIGLGATLDALGRFEEAETHLRRAIALNPQTGHAHSYLGSVLYNQGRYEEAIAAYRVAIQRRPNDDEAHIRLGAIYNDLGRYKEAEAYLRRAIALNPQTGHAHSYLGSVLYNQGRYEEAIAAHHVAIEQDSGFVEAHFNLGVVLDKLGRFEEAETHLRRAIALSPQDMDAMQGLAEVLFRMGQSAQENEQPEVAAEYYMRALEIDPHYTKAIRRLAHLRSEQQSYDEALELFQRLVDINPSDAVAQENMGVVLFYLGRSDEALQRLDQALSLDPTLETARTNRAVLLKAMEGNLK